MTKVMRDPRKTFGAAVSEFAEENERVVVLSADSGGSSGLKNLQKSIRIVIMNLELWSRP